MAFVTACTIASISTVNKQGSTNCERLIRNLIINSLAHFCFYKLKMWGRIMCFFNLSMNNIQIIGNGGEFTVSLDGNVRFC